MKQKVIYSMDIRRGLCAVPNCENGGDCWWSTDCLIDNPELKPTITFEVYHNKALFYCNNWVPLGGNDRSSGAGDE